jgi:hypothetical protein
MKRAAYVLGAASCLLSVIAFGLFGCEEVNDQQALTISPNPATCTATNAIVELTASLSDTNNTLALPLEWSVTETERGHIMRSYGNQAVYARDSAGDNVVVVKDQYDREGYGVIHQP